MNKEKVCTDRIAASPDEVARLLGLGRTTVYQAIGTGALRSSKVGRRRLITLEAAREWLQDLEDVGAQQ